MALPGVPEVAREAIQGARTWSQPVHALVVRVIVNHANRYNRFLATEHELTGNAGRVGMLCVYLDTIISADPRS